MIVSTDDSKRNEQQTKQTKKHKAEPLAFVNLSGFNLPVLLSKKNPIKQLKNLQIRIFPATLLVYTNRLIPHNLPAHRSEFPESKCPTKENSPLFSPPFQIDHGNQIFFFSPNSPSLTRSVHVEKACRSMSKSNFVQQPLHFVGKTVIFFAFNVFGSHLFDCTPIWDPNRQSDDETMLQQQSSTT
jgi:hypothetical protein